MTPKEDLEQRLQRLLRSRRTPVDEERLEEMRQGLRKGSPRREPFLPPIFSQRYRLALPYGMLLVLITLFLWQLYPTRQAGPPLPVGSKLLKVMADEEELDHMLVLLSGFASSSSPSKTLVDWELYNQSALEFDRSGDGLQTFYQGWYFADESEYPSFL